MHSALQREWRAAPCAESSLADVSVVVLSYNRREELVRNLTRLCEAQSQFRFELIVVDNASTDGTHDELARLQQAFPALNVLLSAENLGVARGRNLGWHAAHGEFILNLDDDTRIDPSAIAALRAAAIRTPAAGIFTPRVVHAITGESQNGHDGNLTEPANFHGACHLVRAQTWRAVGDIDTECRFGGEELDYSIRARALGYATIYVPEVRVEHNSLVRKGGNGRWRRQQWVYNYSRVIFKHFPLSRAGMLLTRIIALHVGSAASAGDFRVIPSLVRHAIRGARSGRQQYRALPHDTESFYMSATLQPDFGNVPLSTKIRARLSERNASKRSRPELPVCVQYGCGLSTAAGWNNYDASPTLYLQRLPIAGAVFRRVMRPLFPADARLGDVLKGLPHADSSVDFVYCSHVLEHVCLQDLRTALRETYRILRPNGVFRGVLPDLHLEVRRYLSSDAPDACSQFMQVTALGQESRGRGVKSFLRDWLGNSRHLWMWDFRGLSQELARAGFRDIRRATFGDSADEAFRSVEQRDRWDDSLGFECRK